MTSLPGKGLVTTFGASNIGLETGGMVGPCHINYTPTGTGGDKLHSLAGGFISLSVNNSYVDIYLS